MLLGYGGSELVGGFKMELADKSLEQFCHRLVGEGGEGAVLEVVGECPKPLGQGKSVSLMCSLNFTLASLGVLLYLLPCVMSPSLVRGLGFLRKFPWAYTLATQFACFT